MKKHFKTKFNLDKIEICLLQHENFYDSLFEKVKKSTDGIIPYNDFYLLVDKTTANDKDMFAHLFTDDNFELGTFTFNHSKKYGRKCFFSYSSNSLYSVSSVIPERSGLTKYNFFNYPFYAFDILNLEFNNVTCIEIACDTEANVIHNIQSLVSLPERYDMILLNKKVQNPSETLIGYYEFYPRSRNHRSTTPTLYIRDIFQSKRPDVELRIYDKARELAESRKDKNELIRMWNDMGKNIQRIEVCIKNKPFKGYFEKLMKTKRDEFENIEHYFYLLGMDDIMKYEILNYFASKQLRFKMRNHSKKRVEILDSIVNSYTTLRKAK